jgi:CubicO group peptidase (beta-lactamase class C family)
MGAKMYKEKMFKVHNKRSSCLLHSLISTFIILLLLFPACKSTKSNERISKVENGLLLPVQIKGQPAERMQLAARMEYYKVPGVSIAVINDYKIEWAKGYGVLEAGEARPVTIETLFQAASISKPVAALAVLKMVEQGTFNLDEDVNNKLVTWKVPENEFTSEKKVTLRRLLSHSAGVTVHGFGGYAQDEGMPTLQQVLDGEEPANSDPIRVDILPGTKYRYSGGGYCIVQQLLMDNKNKPFPEIMKETILSPLHMTNSTYEQPLSKEKIANAAVAHRRDGNPIEGKWHTYPEIAAAGLWTTPSDLARFAIELMLSLSNKSNKILSSGMIKQMLTPQQENNGLGIFVDGENFNFRFSHSGGNAGYRCFLVAYPERGQGAVIMTNSDNGWQLYSEILRSIDSEYGWGDFILKEKVLAAVDSKIYDAYIGTYQLSPEITFIITREDGRLYAEVAGMGKSEIYPESEISFFPIDVDATITFVKDETGQVSGIIYKQGERELLAKKVK